MDLFDSSFSFAESVTDEVECINLSEITSVEELTSFGIEYDDDAILAFNPALREDIGRQPVANYAPSDDDLQFSDSLDNGVNRDEVSNFILSNADDFKSDVEDDENLLGTNVENLIENHAPARESQPTNERIMASGDMAFGREHEVQRLTAEIVSEIRSKIPRLDRVKQELSQMHEDIKKLKGQYSELEGNCKKASITQKRTLTTVKAYLNNLDLVIYQNKIIKHLNDAVKQMKLFECHVTADRKIIFVDPDSPGTDIDEPVHISASRVFSLVDSEFKRGCAIGQLEDST